MLVFILHPPNHPKQSKTWAELLCSLHSFGQILFLASIVCLLTALQWAVTTYAWSSSRIIALIIVFDILLHTFITTEFKMGDTATVPFQLAIRRNVLGATLFISIGNNIVNTKLVEGVRALRIPGIEAKMIMQTGVTELSTKVPPEYLDGVLEAYNEALK
ncbi:hypothetical protein N0V90_006976 [Kalmusia sp. IMI 367209]|nr:hypothetical protein N0V90_006976 [Kalmusia sp. IMI 367209]